MGNTSEGSVDDDATKRATNRNRSYLEQLEAASDVRSKQDKDIDSIFEFDDEGDVEEESYMD